MLRSFSFALLWFSLSFNVYSGVPALQEIVIDGLANQPELSVTDLSLKTHQDYLFVIENKFQTAFSFEFAKFGQHVSTYYLQGSSSVTQESFHLLPQSKVVWHFITTKPGEFSIFVQDPATRVESKKAKLKIIE